MSDIKALFAIAHPTCTQCGAMINAWHRICHDCLQGVKQ